MTKIDTYTIKGTKVGELELPKDFSQKVNMDLLAQAVRVYVDGSHPGLRKTQTRAEVKRTGKKIYKQKGTGGARHGSRRAPIYVGGGVALGPRPLRRILNLSDKLKTRAKIAAFSYKVGKGEAIAVKGISKVEKTKETAEFLSKLGELLKASRFTFLISDGSAQSGRFIRNIGNAKFILYRNANAFDVWNGGLLVLDDEIFAKEKPVRADAKSAKKLNK